MHGNQANIVAMLGWTTYEHAQEAYRTASLVTMSLLQGYSAEDEEGSEGQVVIRECLKMLL